MASSSHASGNYRSSGDQHNVNGSAHSNNVSSMFNKTVKVVSGTKKFDGGIKMVGTGGYSRYGGAAAKNVK